MTDNLTKPEGAPVWLALRTADPDGAVAFYGELLGWTAEVTGPGNLNFFLDGARVASMQTTPSENGSQWGVFLLTPDIEKTAAAAEAAGATIAYSSDLGDVGAMLWLVDPTGAEVGAWQPGTHHGFEVEAGAGAPAWHELNTRDFAAAVSFYQRAFGWTTSLAADTDEFRYATFGDQPDSFSGIHDSARDLSADERSHWISYFEIADAETAKARVIELGGSVLSPTWDSPYGKVTVVSDPFGARFVIMERPAG